MRVFRTCRRVVALALVAASALGCAGAVDQGTVIAVNPGDLPQLTGSWQGTFTAPSGRNFPASLRLNADGTYVSSAGAYSSRGLAQARDAKLFLVPQHHALPTLVRSAEATLVMMPDGMAVLSGHGGSESGAFSFEMRRAAP